MSGRWQLTLVAGGASLLASLPLSVVFERRTWLINTAVVVGVIVGIAALLRLLRVPPWVPPPLMALGFVTTLSWQFPSGHEIGRVIPTPQTLSYWNDLLSEAGRDMRLLAVPVDDRLGLLLLCSLGTGAVALLVDLFAVVLRRPALAGLPMLAIYSVPVAVDMKGVNLLAFAGAAVGFLWLLAADTNTRVRRFGRRFAGDGRDLDRWEPSPLGAAGRWLGVLGIGLAVALPLAVPNMTSGWLDRFGVSANGGRGAAVPGSGRGVGQVGLYAYLSGELRSSAPTELLRVQTNDPAPPYLRFGVADELSTDGFRGRPPGGGRPLSSLPDPSTATSAGTTRQKFHAWVTTTNLDAPMVPVYLQPTRVDGLDSSWRYDPDGQVIYSDSGSSSKKAYTFEYLRTDFTPDALHTARPLKTDPPMEQYTAVPSGRATDAVRARVAQLTEGAKTQYDQVLAIFRYFSVTNGFSYTLQTSTGTSGADIIDFLTNKKGFCQQYSAAMAWLVRAAHIPARVAFGFTQGSNHTAGGYTLTSANLHAWTEVYFSGYGWVPFDPTPASAVAGSVTSVWAPDPNLAQNARPPVELPALATPGPDANQSTPPPAAGQGRQPGAAPLVRPASFWRTWWPWVLGGALLTVLILTAPALARIRLRRRRWASPRPPGRARVHGAWDELVDTLIDHRMPLDAAATPRSVAADLVGAARLTGDAADAAGLLGRAEERARYARVPQPPHEVPQPLHELDAALRTVRVAIARRGSLRTRIRASVLPPSVLGRWRSATGAAVDDLGRRRDRARRAMNVRRQLARRAAGRKR